MSILFHAALGLALAMPISARAIQQPASEKAQDPAAEYTALEREFADAQDAYYEPMNKAKSDEERAKIRLDPAKNPVKLYAPRFEDLAKRAKGTEAGARSLLWIASNVRDPKTAGAAIDELTRDYLDSPLLSELTRALRYGSRSLDKAKTRELLEKLASGSPHAEVRASALFALGALLHQEDDGDAVAIFRRLDKEYPGTEWAKAAAGYLFEIEHLQIGMVAPDFEAVDENGAAYRLSDYRGKVVVLDFWGIW